MKSIPKESTRLVEAILKALEVLDCFDDAATLSLKQIVDRTGLVRSRTMRIIGTLISRGYLFFDPESGRYALGSRLMALGNAFKRNNNILRIVRPVLKHLVDETGESSTFCVNEADERVVLARENGKHALRYSIEEGQRMPLHAGASSKALLAFNSQEVLQRLVTKKMLQPITSHTIIDPDRLKVELKKIRKRGYAISTGENTPDAMAIAVPVYDYADHLAGVLSISGPSNRIESSIQEKTQQLFVAAQMLSKAFGHTE